MFKIKSIYNVHWDYSGPRQLYQKLKCELPYLKLLWVDLLLTCCCHSPLEHGVNGSQMNLYVLSIAVTFVEYKGWW
jgi:hypothetical protein